MCLCYALPNQLYVDTAFLDTYNGGINMQLLFLSFFQKMYKHMCEHV